MTIPKVNFEREGVFIHAMDEHGRQPELSHLAAQLQFLNYPSVEPGQAMNLVSDTWSKLGRGLLAAGMIDQGAPGDETTQLLFRPEIEEEQSGNGRLPGQPTNTPLAELAEQSRHTPFRQLPEGMKPTPVIALGANMARVAHAIATVFSDQNRKVTIEQQFRPHMYETGAYRQYGTLKHSYVTEVAATQADTVSNHLGTGRALGSLAAVAISLRNDLHHPDDDVASLQLNGDVGFMLTEIYDESDLCRVTEFSARPDAHLYSNTASIQLGFGAKAYELDRFGSAPEASMLPVLGVEGMIQELRTAARLLGVIATGAIPHETYETPSIYQTGNEPTYHQAAVSHEAVFRRLIDAVNEHRPGMLPTHITNNLPLEDLLFLCNPNVPRFGNHFTVTRFVVGPAEVPEREREGCIDQGPLVTVPANHALMEYDDVAFLSGSGALELYKLDENDGTAQHVDTVTSWVS